ncbi:PH domain-containing protein [Pseudonocardia lacus]|uniref:PH domain-containing protein n=1 Tax=Pseudonocardia lacus TaxID=2835865 RepID=UPI001BDCF185|nr:PH domain-containing protein [Pseudonocardia lacus]
MSEIADAASGAAQEAGSTPPAADETPWRRLDRRMLVVGPFSLLVRVVPVVVVLLLSGQGDPIRVWIAAGAAVAAVVAGVLRWRTTRYRITPERVELHSGWLNRQRRSVPRDRIRTVDLTAKLLHRVFGLSVVRVSAATAGVQAGGGLSLDAVSKAEAERLRRELLEHSPATADRTDDSAAGAPPTQELARLRWAWLRYAPLTFSSIAGMGAIAATAFNLLDDLGLDPRDIRAVDDTAARLAAAPVLIAVAVVALALLALLVVGALLLFAERWYAYRLTREPDGTLRVRRGLLTRRSLSVAERRLRGAEVVEPVLLRLGRGAQARAVSTGLAGDPQGGALQPPAPRAESHRVASAALRVPPEQITQASLRRHPRAALTRRVVRAVGPALVLAAAAFGVGDLLDLGWLGPLALALVPVAALLGWDRYRSLGHQLTGGFLVARSGSLVRRTVALQRGGVIGWTFRQTLFQRRAGLVSLEAVTAAGRGGYTVLDLGARDAVDLADATVPDLLTAFRAPLPAAAGAEHPPGDLPAQRAGRRAQERLHHG